ncbi:MAG TPA: TerB family tellurite resistance protein [Cyclobacteriaceae bacterium]|nr:TerB family tellurite resistance protein [Cyclobacteriaceae bacterium]
MVIHDSFPDFLLFVYVHMSEADHNYDPKEMALIKQKMHALFPKGTDLEKKLYRTIRDYNNFDKAQLDTLFKDTFEKFKDANPELREHLFQDIREIAGADGALNASESQALESLKRIIDLTSAAAG